MLPARASEPADGHEPAVPAGAVEPALLRERAQPVRAADPAAALIDAVFLTSNAREQALECIAHLREPEIASIVVVDNASTDGTAAAIRAAHPDVTVVALDAPTGLASALNRGAALGRAPFVLYLNDDAFAVPGAIRVLLEALLARDDAVAAGGRLVEPGDLTTQDRYRPRDFPSPATVVARLAGLERWWPRNPWTGGHLRRRLDDVRTVAVDQPAGACMLVRRPVAERVGGWDERYWFWYEDVDFSRRLAAHGTQLYVPAAPFRHVGGATARRLRRVDGHRRTFHGVLVYAHTHFSVAGRAFVGLSLAAIAGGRAVIALRADRDAARVYAATARAAVALVAGRTRGLQPEAAASGPRGLISLDAASPQAVAPRAAHATCPVCRASAAATDRFAPAALYACDGCGLHFRAADDDAERGMYADDSYSAERMDALTRHRSHDAALRASWTRDRVAGTRLLEIGAGTGFFVRQATEQGFEAIGVEPSDLSARYARERLHADVRTGFLDTANLPESAFDAICMWHVLEHATDPLALLRGARARLRTNGHLVVEVPNIESVGAQMRRGGWAHLDPGAHVCHFSPRSLTVALQRAGFEVVELETLVESYYDHRSMRLRPRRLAGRAVRAWRLRTLRSSHPTRGELLRVIAAPAR